MWKVFMWIRRRR